MATASPTPMAASHFTNQVNRRPSRHGFRQPPNRQNVSRGFQPAVARETSAHARQYSLNDSSDDEIPMPMKFSALTKALLNDEASILRNSPPPTAQHSLSGSTAVDGDRHVRGSTPELSAAQGRVSPSKTAANSPFPRRVIRLSGSPNSFGLRRTTSLSVAVRKHEEDAVRLREEEPAKSRPESPLDLNTPAPVPRTVRIPITSSASHGQSFGSSGRTSIRTDSGTRRDRDNDAGEEPATGARTQAGVNHGSVSRYGSSTTGRARYGDETGVHNSMRVKRIGNLAGSFLAGPARRGWRRHSEDDQAENGEIQDAAFSSQEPESQESPANEALSSQVSQQSRGSLYSSQNHDFASGSPVRSREVQSGNRDLCRPSASQIRPTEIDQSIRPTSPAKIQPVFRVPAPRPDLPSAHDQENEAPPTFKRNKSSSMALLDKVEKVVVRPQSDHIDAIKVAGSPNRQPLALRSQNTPRRPAPAPPPKMSILETATATAGAATTNAAKKRNNVRVNGKIYTRLEMIGKGGSSKVWRVMAENGKLYALKRVNLEDAPEETVMGFKGEIDLLKKLEGGNDRVVQMLDYEMNDEKQSLSVLMEMGELDFNKILTVRFNGENAKFDPSFTRHYWKEMLECIQVVHDRDVVHSDLKPANFVLVKGRLKLIDFGIANAIQTDETVNVHRESQIGTPNYMSPESLMDANDVPNAKNVVPNQPKLLKLGKPSDIWSLGVILYQMTYGTQPFAHIPNQLSRVRAIINWNYPIEFPSLGLGGAPLPKGLLRTLKRCLNRDQHERPTAAELLDDRDPFLNPVECDEGSIPMTEELLGRILQNAVAKCKDRTPTDVELLSLWPAGYFASLKKSLNA